MNMSPKFEPRPAPSNAMPKMGAVAMNLEAHIHGNLSNAIGMDRVTGGKGTGIIVARDMHQRVFKIEISQVDGPQ